MEEKRLEELKRLQNQNKKNTIRIKFAHTFMKICNNIKNENYIYNEIYNDYLNNWKSICILECNSSLYSLVESLLKDNVYNIRKTIISSITDDKLDDAVYLQFVEEFISL
jgi:hypothetical protein